MGQLQPLSLAVLSRALSPPPPAGLPVLSGLLAIVSGTDAPSHSNPLRAIVPFSCLPCPFLTQSPFPTSRGRRRPCHLTLRPYACLLASLSPPSPFLRIWRRNPLHPTTLILILELHGLREGKNLGTYVLGNVRIESKYNVDDKTIRACFIALYSSNKGRLWSLYFVLADLH